MRQFGVNKSTISGTFFESVGTAALYVPKVRCERPGTTDITFETASHTCFANLVVRPGSHPMAKRSLRSWSSVMETNVLKSRSLYVERASVKKELSRNVSRAR